MPGMVIWGLGAVDGYTGPCGGVRRVPCVLPGEIQNRGCGVNGCGEQQNDSASHSAASIQTQ